MNNKKETLTVDFDLNESKLYRRRKDIKELTTEQLIAVSDACVRDILSDGKRMYFIRQLDNPNFHMEREEIKQTLRNEIERRECEIRKSYGIGDYNGKLYPSQLGKEND